jgi:release factor glutamine methyltransferase
MLVMEHADVQGPATRELAESSGRFENITTARDLTGRDRFLSAYRTK